MAENKRFIITKKIAKHGKQTVIIIPRMLEQHLKPGTMMQLTIDVIDSPIVENFEDKLKDAA